MYHRLRDYPKSKISLEQLEQLLKPDDYEELVKTVMQLQSEQILNPVKAQGKNGKKPALYKSYWIQKEKKSYETYRQELLLLDCRLSNDYYLRNMEQYGKDRKYILRLNQYFLKHMVLFENRASLNERSFELFYREKFISKEQGKRILKNLGLSVEQLNCYETCEPLAYYSYERTTPQNILIIENKDTYYTVRAQLQSGINKIFQVDIGTVIYGAGKGIYRSFEDLHTSVESYVNDSHNTIYYFGDLDYEGILIYETLAKRTKEALSPFVPAYESMLQKAENIELPETKENQNRNLEGTFFEFFSRESKLRMLEILQSGLYIPQEIIQTSDLHSDIER